MGIVTLALALLFIIGWLRSHITRDVLCFTRLQSVQSVASVEGSILLEAKSPLVPEDHIAAAQLSNDDINKYWEPWEIQWTWRKEWCGLLFGSGVLSLSHDKVPLDERRTLIGNPIEVRRVEVWIIPYWSIITPLTIASAALLLSKRPTSKKNIKERVPDAVLFVDR